MSTEVRRAGQADLVALVSLNEAVQNVHTTIYPAIFKLAPSRPDVREFFAPRLAEEKSTIAIAEVDRQPAGHVWFDIDSRPETPFTYARRRIYLHHISVQPQVRRQGVGFALIGFVEQRALADCVAEIVLGLWIANADARRFFTSLGFGDLILTVSKKLPS